jgi:hypothetical protein
MKVNDDKKIPDVTTLLTKTQRKWLFVFLGLVALAAIGNMLPDDGTGTASATGTDAACNFGYDIGVKKEHFPNRAEAELAMSKMSVPCWITRSGQDTPGHNPAWDEDLSQRRYDVR